MERIGRLGWIQIDCRDPVKLAAFWGAVLGLEVDPHHLGDPPQYVGLVPTSADDLAVTFQRVPEPKVVKNRLHLDVEVDDVNDATTRVEGLGGERLSPEDFHEHGFSWRVMRDPEGNEFCLIY